jgi:hypothetical protein
MLARRSAREGKKTTDKSHQSHYLQFLGLINHELIT